MKKVVNEKWLAHDNIFEFVPKCAPPLKENKMVLHTTGKQKRETFEVFKKYLIK